MDSLLGAFFILAVGGIILAPLGAWLMHRRMDRWGR